MENFGRELGEGTHANRMVHRHLPRRPDQSKVYAVAPPKYLIVVCFFKPCGELSQTPVR